MIVKSKHKRDACATQFLDSKILLNMKLLILLISLIVTFDNYGKDKNNYTVIGIKSKVIVVSSSKELTLLDSFNRTDIIKIDEGSYIAFIDDAINVFEYHGPRIIKVDTLRGRSKREIYKKQKLGPYPDLKLINSDIKPLIKPVKDSNRGFQIYHPNPFSKSILISDKTLLNIRWVDGGMSEGKYKFLMINEFGDSIDQREAIQNSFQLDLAKVKSRDKLFFWILDVNHNRQTSVISITITDKTSTHDVNLNDQSPALNFITAIFLEENGIIDEAEVHYLRAAALGVGIEPYAMTLEKFKSRWDR